MKGLLFSQAAHEDLLEIWCYIAKDNPDAADLLEHDIRLEAQTLVALPTLGHRRQDLTQRDVWFHTVRKHYLLVYRWGEAIEIVRVLHGARDVAAELDDTSLF